MNKFLKPWFDSDLKIIMWVILIASVLTTFVPIYTPGQTSEMIHAMEQYSGMIFAKSPADLPMSMAPLMTQPITGSKVIAGTYAIWQQEGNNCLFGVRTPKGWTGDYFAGNCPTNPDDAEGIARLFTELWDRFTKMLAELPEEGNWNNNAYVHIQGMIDLAKDYGLTLEIILPK